jgi:phage terminase large subunit-like protein
VKDYFSRLISRLDGSFVQVLSGIDNAKHGFNAGFVLFDEFHEQPNRVLWNTMRYAGEARPQPLVGWISTAGFDVDRPWVEQWDYARGVRDGTIVDIGYLGVIYEASESDDYRDPAVWKKANPSLGIVLNETKFGEKLAEVEREGPTSLRDFRILRLNQRLKPGSQSIGREVWDSLAEAGVSIPESTPCFAGLDLAETRDVNALALVAWDGSRVIHECHFAYPATCPDKEQTNKDLFDKWTAAGWMHRTPGNFVDPDALSEWLIGILKKRNLRKLHIDPSRAGYVITKLQDAGIKVERFTQNHANYNLPYRELEKFITARRFVHQGNPVMSWMWGNLHLDTNRQGLVRPEKPKARHLKIDGVPATLMGFAELTKHIPKGGGEFSGW